MKKNSVSKELKGRFLRPFSFTEASKALFSKILYSHFNVPKTTDIIRHNFHHLR